MQMTWKIQWGRNRQFRLNADGFAILRRHRIFGPLPFVRWETVVSAGWIVSVFAFFLFLALAY
jgi:hypothetical protein